jgi:tRNA U34 5-carboxymethylaminomethyl modifying GTPase MnmE/TrmE
MTLTNKQIIEKYLLLRNKSDFKTAQEKAEKYLGKDALLKISEEKNKKYQVLNPSTNKYVSFGDIRYEDYTKHKDPVRRQSYLKRATKIKGDWKIDKYSPNSLAINILW